MRVIVIEEDRFTDLTATLESERIKSEGWDDGTAARLGIDKQAWRAALDEAHRRYHYHFVKWAQSHGASCVRK